MIMNIYNILDFLILKVEMPMIWNVSVLINILLISYSEEIIFPFLVKKESKFKEIKMALKFLFISTQQFLKYSSQRMEVEGNEDRKSVV